MADDNLIYDFDRSLIENIFVSPADFNTKVSTLANNSLSIYHHNIRGCRTNFDHFKCFVTSLKTTFSFIALTETNISEDIDYNYELPGYYCINHFSNHGNKFYCLRSLQCNKTSDLCLNNEFIESLFINISHQSLDKLCIGVIYRPHANTIANFNNYLENNVMIKFKRNVNYIITGDFNINLLAHNSNEHVKNFSNILMTKNLVPSIFCVTRPNNLNPLNSTCIDHFWSNICLPHRTYVIENYDSDHFPIAYIVENVCISSKIKITFCDFSNRNFEKFRTDFPALINDYNGNLIEPESAVSDLNKWLMSILNNYFPIKNKSISIKRLNSPWISDDVLKCIQKKHELYRLHRDGLLPKEVYVKFKNVLTVTLKKLKSAYFQNAFEIANHDISQTWKILNDITRNSKKRKMNDITFLDYPDAVGTTENQAEIVNIFKDHFVNGPKKLVDQLPVVVPSLNYDNLPSNHRSIFFSRSNSNEVVRVLKAFANKSCGVKDVPIKILKSIACEIAPLLSTIFNLIIQTGIYPDSLKIVRVRPIFKTGNRLDVSNYRPISVLPTLNKIFEKLLLVRLNSFIECNHTLTETQFGFREHRGTQDACLSLIEKLQMAYSNNLHSLVVFIDLKSAFDTVHFNRLLFKLEKIGIRGIALQLFNSYLTNRKLFVGLDDFSSDLSHIESGVPQGSSLSATLFNIYINDCVYFLSDTLNFLYADDTSLLRNSQSIEDLYNSMQRALNIFFEWTVHNLLTINTSKTKVMFISRSIPRPLHCHIRINNADIEFVENFKYLGLVIDSNLSFSNHISFLHKKLSSLTGMTFAVSHLLTLPSARHLYFTLVQSLLIYMITFWASTTETNLNMIQACQNKIIPNLFKEKMQYFSINDLYKQCNILTVRSLYQLEMGKLCFKALFSNRANPLRDYFFQHNWTHAYNTRKIYQFRTPKRRTLRESRHVNNKSIEIWNSIPIVNKNSTSVAQFKTKYAKFLLSNQNVN